MNKFKNILLSSLLLSSFVSCSDFLQYDKVGEASSDSFWITESDAESAADGLYFFMAETGVVGRGFMHYYNCSDDVVTGRTQSGCDNMKNFVADYSRDVTDNWPYMYQLIKRCNDIFLNVPSMDISDEVRNEVLGQAYFFRGWAQLWLAPYYGDNGSNGGIPIVTEDITMDEWDVPRAASVCDNYEAAIEDFKKAAELLSYFSELADVDYGRPHKTACWAYIAKAALYNAQYDSSYYDMVTEYCDKVINSGEHALYPDFRELFTVANNYSSEYIFSFVSNYVTGSILPGVLLENKGWGEYNGWGYFTPTLELVNAFEEGDKRLAATVLQPGDEFEFLGTTRIYYSSESYSGMMLNKFSSPFASSDAIGSVVNANGDYPATSLNIPLVRYAEVLLWKAEAEIWTGGNGDDEINLVRARAGLESITNATKADLKNERRCELAGEFTNRHLDLVRWGDAQEVYAEPLHGYTVSIKSTSSSVTSKDDLEITETQVWAARSFNPSINHVFPIPATEVSSSVNLTQNIGY
ncbi:MAG: RagB/SusD family nutrient uptake outer membrane protein [Rikenellaceae bacterium]